MPELKVRLAGSEVTDNGEETKLIATDTRGRKVTLAFPSSDNQLLMAALNQAASGAAQRKLNDPTLKSVLPLEWWEVNPYPAGNGVLLTFRMPGGMEMSFHLPNDVAARYQEVFASVFGRLVPPEGFAQRH